MTENPRFDYTVDSLRNALEYWGELHVVVEDGVEYHLHKHDVVVEATGAVHVVSKHGDWSFDVNDVADVEYPHSHKE